MYDWEVRLEEELFGNIQAVGWIRERARLSIQYKADIGRYEYPNNWQGGSSIVLFSAVDIVDFCRYASS